MLFSSALGSSTAIVGYLALFAAIGFGFIFVNLLVGRFLRPDDPHVEKQEIYECGEPSIGSSFVQFDLRFYVVALVFIIFDVEVAFLFPWATVYGKAVNLMHSKPAAVQMTDGYTTAAQPVAATYKDSVIATYQELGVRNPVLPAGSDSVAGEAIAAGAKQLATLALVTGSIFFAVLFVGFAYEWKTGALDWVKSIRTQNAIRNRRAFPVVPKTTPQGSVLSA